MRQQWTSFIDHGSTQQVSCKASKVSCEDLKVRLTVYLADFIIERCHVPNDASGSLIHSNAAPHEGRHHLIFKLSGVAPAAVLLPVYLLQSLQCTSYIAKHGNVWCILMGHLSPCADVIDFREVNKSLSLDDRL